MVKLLLVIILILAMLLAACRSEPTDIPIEPEEDYYEQVSEPVYEPFPPPEPEPETDQEPVSEPELYATEPELVPAPIPPEATPEELGIILEFVRYSPDAIDLVIANNSELEVRHEEGFTLSRNWLGSSHAIVGTIGFEADVRLLPGQRREVQVIDTAPFDIHEQGGEFRVTKRIEVGPVGNARELELHAEFALDDPTIPQRLQTVAIAVELAMPVGAVVAITNGFSEGRLFYGRNYAIHRNVGGVWQDVPRINISGALPPDTRSLGPRQQNDYLVRYWAWLYGELPAGRYRIMKTLLHDTGEGDPEQVVRYAEFTLDGQPVPEYIPLAGGGHWVHPFGGIATLRAQAIKMPEDMRQFYADGTLLVRTSEWQGIEDEEARASIWDNHTVTVLDANGNQIPFSEIPMGALLDVTYVGFMLMPAIPPIDALLIEIVG